MTYKKLFIDSDIFLDLFFKREPFFIYSKSLLSDEIKAQFDIYTSTIIVANIHYIVSKNINKATALSTIKLLMNTVKVLAFNAEHIDAAIDEQHVDFEDRIQYYIAKQNNCDLIISRNIKHYKNFDLPVLTAEDFLRMIL